MQRFVFRLRAYLAVVAATALVFVYPATSGRNLYGPLILLPILVGAGLGGLWPGLFATVVVMASAAAVLLSRTVSAGRLVTAGGPISFFLFGFLVSWLFDRLHRARRRLEERQRQLEDEVELRQRAEEMATNERERLRVTLASIGDAVIATDSRGRVTFVNPVAEALTGWPAEQAVGQLLTDVFTILSEETRQPVENPVSQVQRDGAVVGLANHTILLARDGTEHAIADSAAPIRDVQGTMTGVVLVFRDNSAERQAERSLREMDRQKNEFLAMLSHELRNPLAPIRSAVDLMRADPHDDASRRLAVETIHSQTEHLSRLVDDLLDVARIMSGKISLRPDLIELHTIIDRAVATTRSMVEAGGHTLSVEVPPAPVWLQADPVRLNQILINLLHNACKYTPAGGRIELTAAHRKGQLELRVRDNGLGISPELLPSLFRLFVQAERDLDRSQGGLGIGLALSRTLAHLHGGELLAESPGPGKGSEFTLRLPILTAPPPERTEAESFAPVAMPQLRVLVVDDNRSAAVLLQRLLEKFWRHEVAVAHDGEAALSAAERFRPQWVFLDIGLPKLDGYEVARRLRQSSEFLDVRIVAVTGYGTDADRLRSSEAGFDEHLVKPVAVDTLQQLFQRHFREAISG